MDIRAFDNPLIRQNSAAGGGGGGGVEIDLSSVIAGNIIDTFAPAIGSLEGLYMRKDDGSILLAPDSSNKRIRLVNNDVPFIPGPDLGATNRYVGGSSVDGVDVSRDGKFLAYCRAIDNYVFICEMTTPWDISLWSQRVYDLTTAYYPRAVRMNADGSKFYICNGSTITEFTMASNYLPATTILPPVDVNLTNLTSATTAFCFNSTGTVLYVVTGSEDLYSYRLGTAWDISTIDLVSGTQTQDTSPIGIAAYDGIDVTDDGTKMYLLDDADNKIFTISTSIL